MHLKNLPGRETEIGAQALDDFGIGARFDLQAHRCALAAAMKLRVHRIENAARFFLAQIEIAVARDAKRSGGEDFVAVVEALGVCVHDVVQENVFDGSFRRGNAEDARKGARNGDHAQIDLRIFALALAAEKPCTGPYSARAERDGRDRR